VVRKMEGGVESDLTSVDDDKVQFSMQALQVGRFTDGH